MEAFALLRYWCTTAGGAAATITRESIFNARRIAKPAAATPYSGYGFDGPYIDLDFTLNQKPAGETSDSTETENGEEGELRFSVESDESDGQIVKSATGFRVLLLNLKSDSEKSGKIEANGVNDVRENQGRVRGEMLTVEFDLKGDKGRLVSLFARDESNSASDDRNLGKEMSQRCLNPLYIRVEKMKLSGHGGPLCTPCTVAEKGRSNVKICSGLQAWVNVMFMQLGKSRSTPAAAGMMGSNRREELVVVEEGIQGAILHCKRSFNSNRGN